MRSLVLAAFLAATPGLAAETLLLAPQTMPEWKAVHGRVEARDLVPARARIGGTVAELLVTEGDEVAAGDRIATIRDDKIGFQIAAFDAQISALEAELARARTELARGRSLLAGGVTTSQRLEQLATHVDVTLSQIAAMQAQRSVVVQQDKEGEVLAPAAGRVLSVPVTRGAVVMAGEPLAVIGGGGFFLRLAVPERHAADLAEGASMRIALDGGERSGRLAKIYPRIEAGRIIADVEVEGLEDALVDARVLVEVPVGTRAALLVPEAAVATRSGLDFVSVATAGGEMARNVVTGETMTREGGRWVEILTGLAAGDTVIIP